MDPPAAGRPGQLAARPGATALARGWRAGSRRTGDRRDIFALLCPPELSFQAEAVRLPADQPQGSAQLLPATVCSFTPQERAWEGVGDPWGARGAVASPCLHQTFGMQYLPFPTPQGCSLVPITFQR